MDIGWKLRRISHLLRRLKGSIAIRGWRGTLRRAMRDRGVESAVARDEVEPCALRAPAGGAPHRRILVVETMTPDPTRDSGSMRLCQIFELLNADGWFVDFVADDDDATARDVARLAALGAISRSASSRYLCRLVHDQWICFRMVGGIRYHSGA